MSIRSNVYTIITYGDCVNSCIKGRLPLKSDRRISSTYTGGGPKTPTTTRKVILQLQLVIGLRPLLNVLVRTILNIPRVLQFLICILLFMQLLPKQIFSLIYYF